MRGKQEISKKWCVAHWRKKGIKQEDIENKKEKDLQ